MTKYRYYNNQRLILLLALLIPLAIMMLLIGNLIPQNVYSHANPTSFTPSSNSVVGENGTLPKKAVIVFSERPEPKASYIRVTNSDNERVDKRHADDLSQGGGRDDHDDRNRLDHTEQTAQ